MFNISAMIKNNKKVTLKLNNGGISLKFRYKMIR